MNLQPLLQSSAAESRTIVDAFFAAVDAKQSLAQWVLPQTSVVWNGTPLAGSDALAQMLAQTPRTAHTIGGFNCHPLPNNNFTVTATGSVTIGEEQTRDGSAFGFSAFFVFAQIPNGPWAIQTMTYRLVHKPDDTMLYH